MGQLRVAMTALSHRIFAGYPAKDGQSFRGTRHDVTSDVLKAISEYVGMDQEKIVTVDGVPQFIVAVRSIKQTEQT